MALCWSRGREEPKKMNASMHQHQGSLMRKLDDIETRSVKLIDTHKTIKMGYE